MQPRYEHQGHVVKTTTALTNMFPGVLDGIAAVALTGDLAASHRVIARTIVSARLVRDLGQSAEAAIARLRAVGVGARHDRHRPHGCRSSTLVSQVGRIRAHARAAAQHRSGPVGPRPSGAAQSERALQEGRRRAQRPQRIENIYAYRGFDSIDPSDLRGRMRWWGLYTQRRPGIGGGLTGSLEPEELDDKFFMLRVRIDGGRLTSEQLRDHRRRSAPSTRRDTADVTDRQNVQLHWIRIEDMPAIWQRLEATGLSTTEACGDTPRVILGCPLAGDDANEIIDGTPAHRRGRRAATSARPSSPTCRASSRSAISGCPDHCTIHEINDISFVGVRRSRWHSRLRPVGRRRPVHQSQAGRAPRRLRDPGAAARGLGRCHVDLP